MNKLVFTISAILFAGSVLATPSTATLVNANGSVMVNSGKQFISADTGAVLTTGDRVMVMDGGNASIKYAEGCVVDVKAGSVVTVTNQEACVAGNQATSQVAPMTAQSVVGKGQSYTAYWAAGAAVILVCALAVCTDNSNDKSVTSP